jgi:uncharacterized DUF497 family protein
MHEGGDVLYQWDEEKNRINRAKHGVRFEQATKVFDDPFVVDHRQDVEHGEYRYSVLGLVDGVVILLVVFTDLSVGLGEPVTRIISARRADRSERLIYEKERNSHR